MSTTAKLLEIEEGFRNKPYYCSEGYPTIGIGTRIGPKGADLKLYEFAVSREIAELLLSDRLGALETQLSHEFKWFDRLCEQRKSILISMCYQFGLTGFLEFKKTIEYLEAGNFRDASVEMLDSLWYKIQTPDRASRHAEVMRYGDYSIVNYYSSLC